MKSKHLLAVGAVASVMLGTAALADPAAHYGSWGFDVAGMDRSVRPGDDFFRYANGKAVASLAIPADRPRYGSFDRVYELSETRLHGLIETMVASGEADATSDEGKMAALFTSFMDERRLEFLDAEPLASDLAAVRGLETHEQIGRAMGASMGGFGGSLFRAFVDVDQKSPNSHALYLAQAGLGLPDRDYYLKDAFKEKRARYQAYVAQMLELAGWTDPTASAQAIVELETRLAQVHWTRVESRDSQKTYNPLTVAELEGMAPGFPWRAFLESAGAAKVSRVIVVQDTAFPKMAAIFADTPMQTLRAWQAFHGVDRVAPLLSRRFADAEFAFRSKALQGVPQQKPRWKRGIGIVGSSFGEALGRSYVARYFPPASKAKMQALVADLTVAMRNRIERLDWMTPQTKTRALEKLSKLRVKIGYPDKWRDYSGLRIERGDLYGDVARSRRFEWAFNLAKLGRPVDPDAWNMTPQTVNAYYSPTRNEIVFPAAVLQPPFFDPDADPAVNYGAIGSGIGHEIGHGFDDQGRKFDGDGMLRDWWTPADVARFEAQTSKLGAQYDGYEPIPGAKVQGGLTMGENIGDLAGATLAIEAYHLSLKGRPAPVIDGFTGDQRLFLGMAQLWREKARDDFYRQQVTTDPHAPARFRAIGPLRNMDAWYAAFDVKPADAYYLAPDKRVRIW